MAVKIRLARAGAKKRPFYRIVIAEVTAPRDGRFIEKVGTYNPMLPKDSGTRVTLDVERIKYWLSVGALPTDRVERFLAQADLIAPPAQKSNLVKGVPKKKAQERLEADKKAAEAQKAAKEAPVEVTPPEVTETEEHVPSQEAEVAPEAVQEETPAPVEETSAPTEEASSAPEAASPPASDSESPSAPEAPETETPAPEEAKEDAPVSDAPPVA